MLKIKNTIKILCIIAIIILSFNACGVKEIIKNYNSNDTLLIQETTKAASYLANKKITNVYEEAAVDDIIDGDFGVSYSSNKDTNQLLEKKIIKNYSIDVESINFDVSIKNLNEEIKKIDGIIDNSSINNNLNVNNNRKKYASFTIRVPYEKADSFIDYINKNFNIILKNEFVEDVTDDYYDINTKIDNLKKEEEKLNQLSSKAKNVDELIKIEERISNVRYEIERLYNRIKYYDKQINYSTIYLSITEVGVVIADDTKNLSFSKDQILLDFNKNLEATKKFVVNAAIFFFTHIPAFCLIAFVVLIYIFILMIIDTIKKHPKNKNVSKDNKEIKKEDTPNQNIETDLTEKLKKKMEQNKNKQVINLPTTENKNKEIEIEARKINEVKIASLVDDKKENKPAENITNINNNIPNINNLINNNPTNNNLTNDNSINNITTISELEKANEDVKTKMIKDLENKYKEHYIQDE